jgi:hypothetical protein
MLSVLVEVHPAALEPVTVYCVLRVGLTTTDVPVKAPGFHVYDTAPFAVKVDELPRQIDVGDPAAVIVGFEFTVSKIVFVFVHEPFAPVTVYVVVTVGETTTEVPVNEPGFHEYVVAPEPVRVADDPTQIAVGVLDAVTVGFVFTTIEIVRVPVQVPLVPSTV